MDRKPIPVNRLITLSDQRKARRRNIALVAITAVLVVVTLILIGRAFGSQQALDDEPAYPPATVSPEPTITEDPTPVATPTPTPTAVVLYDDCADVWKKLGRPIYSDEAGFRDYFDWDANGVGCEDNPSTKEDEADIDWPAVRERFAENLDDLGDAGAPKVKEFVHDAKEFFSN